MPDFKATETTRRRPLRLRGYDYSQEGAYFITLCTHRRQFLLAKVTGNEVHLNGWGKAVESEWLQTAILRPYVSLDAYVVMPNHFHGILLLHGEARATQRIAPTGKDRLAGLMPASIGAIVGQFKSQVTKKLKTSGRSSKEPFWQRNYYEHVIRDEDDLNRIREYIQSNPVRWLEDEYYAP